MSLQDRVKAVMGIGNQSEGVASFDMGTFAGGTSDRAEFSARLYHEVSLLTDMLDSHGVEPKRTLEVGCGYGRLSPWIANLSEAHYGVEPDKSALAKAETLYPESNYRHGVAQDLPFDDDSFDLLVTWTVLQHIPPADLEDAVSEIRRVLSPDGYLLLCEETTGETLPTTWPRPVAEYESLFDECDLKAQQKREIEETYPEHSGVLMLLNGGSDK